MFEDWNGDGKIDLEDEFLEYMMFEEVFGGKSSSSCSSNTDGCGCVILAAVLFLLFFL